MSKHHADSVSPTPLSLILIASNAGVDIEALVAGWIAQLDALGRPYEVLIVDDGSTDDTAILADMLAGKNKHVRAIHHSFQQGIGAALRSGIAAAQHPLVAYTTLDRQYQPGELNNLLERIDKAALLAARARYSEPELKALLENIDKVDVVTGCRVWLPVPSALRWLGYVWRTSVRVLFGVPLDPLPTWLGDRGQQKRWLARWIFGVRVHDVECAFRVLRRTIFKRIPIQSSGPFAQVEILAKANFLGCWMAEVPVTYQPPAGPAVRGSLNPSETYLSEAFRVFKAPSFSAKA